MRTICHVDIDAFFAQVEQRLDPSLAGRPVIVGGTTNRGVVASASYEAKKFGVKTAMPIAQARKLCPKAAFLNGHHARYAEASAKLHAALLEFTPDVEMASLDEAYVDLTGCERFYGVAESPARYEAAIPPRPGPLETPDSKLGISPAVQPETPNSKHETSSWLSPLELAERIKRRVKEATGLNVSIGVSTNKLVSKIGSDYAKPNGIVWIHPGREAAFVAPLALRDIPGIGPHTAERLEKLNLHHIADLRRLSENQLEGLFGSSGSALFRHARGESESPVVAASGPPQSISRESTFDADTQDREGIAAMLHYLTERAAHALRAEGMVARTVTARIRYADFSTVSMSRTLPDPADEDPVFFETAWSLVEKLYTRRMCLRLVGVSLSNFLPAGIVAAPLFDREPLERRRAFYRALDRIRDRHGFGAVTRGLSMLLLHELESGRDGFRLHTPSLTR